MLGSRISTLRRQQGMSQADLAGRLHISASAVGMYEQGRRQPSLDLVVAMAEELKVSTDFLLTGKLWNTPDPQHKNVVFYYMVY